LPGFRDFYPEPLPHPDVWSADARRYIVDKWHETARRYGFREYDGPPLEPLELYTLKSGEEIIGQLYNFQDKSERQMALRPEMTPTLARMIASHERNYKKPIKWFAVPQLFRYERQQRGRMREHFQFNADIIGEKDVSADAELIALLIDTLRSFGLTHEDFVVRLSSRNAWHDFFQARQADSAREYEFYQVVDKLEREERAVSDKKLQALGISPVELNDFIEKGNPSAELQSVLDNLRARGLGDYVAVDYHIIRGLAYYTGVVFEAFDRKGDLRAIAGGGRYDNLVKLVSGNRVDLSALGFGMGDVVLLELLQERKLLPKFDPRIDVVCLIENETSRPDALGLVQQLREAGLTVEYSLTAAKSDKQFKRALELKAGFTVKPEQNPDGSRGVRVKNLNDRSEQVLPVEVAVQQLKRDCFGR
jgi:histidyl-tRNA synthetase